jgi:hypothetical protein
MGLVGFKQLFLWERRCINYANKIAVNPKEFIWCEFLILIQQ